MFLCLDEVVLLLCRIWIQMERRQDLQVLNLCWWTDRVLLSCVNECLRVSVHISPARANAGREGGVGGEEGGRVPLVKQTSASPLTIPWMG